MPIPPDLLIAPAQLSRYNVPSAFLAQFNARPFLVQISTGGALGSMAFEWQFVGDSAWSPPILSVAGASFANTIEDAFVDLSFSAATYNAQDTYLIDTAGNVNPVGSALVGVFTATTFDLRQSACSSVTSEAMYLMRDAIRPPLLTWGDDARTHAAAWVFAVLKRGRGLTPEGAGTGDDNVFKAETMARDFFKDIGENGRPDSMTDTSPSADGPLIAAYPSGDCLRGW